jgi:type I restriction enzyme S subunit
MAQSATVPLKDFCRVVQGGRLGFSGVDFVAHGYPAYGAGGINGYVSVHEFDEPAVILSSIGARCGKCFHADGRWMSLANTQLIFPDPSRADSRFLWFQLNDETRWHRSGTAQPFIKPSDVKAHRVFLPSLVKQRRIADVLDRAEALRVKRRAALAQLDTLTQSIFLDMFGDPGANPRSWPERTIGDVARVLGGKRLPKGDEYSADPTPYRYIRVTDLKAGAVDESKLVYLKPETQAVIKRYIVHTGDVIISIAGSTGLIAPVSNSLEGANLTENAAKLVPRSVADYDAGYLATVLRTPFAQRQIDSHVGQVTIGKLALFRIEKIRVPIPPLPLQHEFSRRVAAVATMRTAHRASIAAMDMLFSALQLRAFQGEL